MNWHLVIPSINGEDHSENQKPVQDNPTTENTGNVQDVVTAVKPAEDT